MDGNKIKEIRKVISVLKWDLNIIKNEQIKANKQSLLKKYEDELKSLTQNKEV